MRFVLCVALLPLLVLLGTLEALAVPSYECIHDALSLNVSEPPPEFLVRELPTKDRQFWAMRSASSKEWAPIRILTSFSDLSATGKYCASAGAKAPDFRGGEVDCTAEGVLTTERRQLLVSTIVPEAVKLHSERLSVAAAEGKLKLRMLTAALLFKECDEFTVPREHTVDGAGVDADFALYVASSPAPTFTARCAFGPGGRPTAGVLNFATPMISASRFSVRVAAHEIAHALGFYRHAIEKLEYSDSRVRDDGSMVPRIILSPTVKEVVRKYYGCDEEGPALGMALEGPDLKTYRKLPAHWSQRDAKDELMSSHLDPSGGFYSALTLALFHDLPYYKADFSKAEPMQWGMGLGCGFLKERCRGADGSVKRLGMHCSDPSGPMQCTASRLALGSCQMSSPISKIQQYFSSHIVVSTDEKLPEYCPVVTSTVATSCLDGDATKMPGSLVGPLSRCLKAESVALNGRGGSSAIGDICANVRCDADRRTVSVQYMGDPTWHTCGGSLDLSKSPSFAQGTIACPDFNSVCAPLVSAPAKTTALRSKREQWDGAAATLIAPAALLLACVGAVTTS